MTTIEFQTRIDNGSILIPEQFRERIKGIARITVEIEEDAPGKEEDFIQYLMRNPLEIPDFKPMTRDEIYDRN